MGKNPNCDLQLIRFLGEAALEAWAVIQDETEVTEGDLIARVQEVLAHLIKYPVDSDGFQVMEGVPLTASHQHHNHLMGIYPLGIIAWDTAELRVSRPAGP